VLWTPLFCIQIMVLPPTFLTLWIYSCIFKTKHQFTPIPSSFSNGVNFYKNDKYAHVILYLFFMAIYDLPLI